MKSFSQRQGIERIKVELQTNDVDQGLRTRLWNVLTTHYWRKAETLYPIKYDRPMSAYLHRLWHHYFKEPVDSMPDHWSSIYPLLRARFFGCEWNKVYDFIEITALLYPDPSLNERFRAACNAVLEEELSGYRFVTDHIAPITSEQEILSIESGQKMRVVCRGSAPICNRPWFFFRIENNPTTETQSRNLFPLSKQCAESSPEIREERWETH